MINQIIGILFSFIITLMGLPLLIRFAESNKLFVPNDYRRTHTSKVSALGGIVIFVSASLSFLLFSDLINFPDYRFIISSGILMFILGFYDDLNEVKPEIKLLGQTVAISLLVIFADVRIEFLQHSFNLHIGIWADTILTIIIMLAIINAYNFIDGIDMLAAMLGFIIMGILGIWFFAVDQYDYSLALLTLSASLLAFMIYNHSPAKIFMGDTGTMTIGLIMALSLIKFDMINSIILSPYSFVNAPGIAFSFVSLLLFDLVRVSVSRIIKGKSPFHADNNHIHHLFVRMGINHNTISMIIGFAVIAQIVLSIILDSYINSNFIIILINIAYLLLFYSIVFMALPKNKYNKMEV